MHSSTSNSNRRAAERGIVILLAVLLAAYAATELVAKFGFSHISRIQRRIAQEHAALRGLPRMENGKLTLLICGNSLLLDGVDVPELERRLGRVYAVHRYVIEQTEYWDWFYGLRRLFREGMRPAAVALLLSPSQLMSNATRGEYFAYFMMDPRDTWAVKRASHLNLTTTSDYALAAKSGWLGAKAEIRKWFLGRIFPDLADLTASFRPQRGLPSTPDEISAVVPDRLKNLQNLCELYGTRVILVQPPAVTDKTSEIVQRVGAAESVRVLVPYQTLPADHFTDGFHLNETGKKLFTEKLAHDLAAQRLL